MKKFMMSNVFRQFGAFNGTKKGTATLRRDKLYAHHKSQREIFPSSRAEDLRKCHFIQTFSINLTGRNFSNIVVGPLFPQNKVAIWPFLILFARNKILWPFCHVLAFFES